MMTHGRALQTGQIPPHLSVTKEQQPQFRESLPTTPFVPLVVEWETLQLMMMMTVVALRLAIKSSAHRYIPYIDRKMTEAAWDLRERHLY